MGLIGSFSTTIPNQQVVYIQYTSDPCKHSTSRLKCPAILFKTSLIGLIVFNLRENPLTQITVPCNNLVSHLRIIYYFTSIDFAQSLMPQQKVIVAALAKMAFTEHPPKLLVNFIYKI
jgi:hypothetical protein